MKRVMLPILALTLALAGCSSAPAAGAEFTGEVNTLPEVTLNVTNAYPGQAEVTLTNGSDVTVYGGNTADYGLQARVDGQWHWLEQKGEFANTAEAVGFDAGGEYPFTCTWGRTYGSLEPGQYRLTKWVFTENEDGSYADFLLAGEFTLE